VPDALVVLAGEAEVGDELVAVVLDAADGWR